MYMDQLYSSSMSLPEHSVRCELESIEQARSSSGISFRKPGGMIVMMKNQCSNYSVRTTMLKLFGQSFSRGARSQEKGKKKNFRASTCESGTKCHVGFRQQSTAIILRTTSDTPTEARNTGQLRDRQLAVVVACLCIGGSCALPLVLSCLCKTCGVLDGLAATAHQNIRSYDVLVPGIILTGKVI